MKREGERLGEATIYSDDRFEFYLTLIRQVPALDRIEEGLCIKHVRANDQQAEASRTRLVEANLQLVVSVAERYRSDRIHILDLIEKGNSGLLQAVESLDACSDSFSATQLSSSSRKSPQLLLPGIHCIHKHSHFLHTEAGFTFQPPPKPDVIEQIRSVPSSEGTAFQSSGRTAPKPR